MIEERCDAGLLSKNGKVGGVDGGRKPWGRRRLRPYRGGPAPAQRRRWVGVAHPKDSCFRLSRKPEEREKSWKILFSIWKKDYAVRVAKPIILWWEPTMLISGKKGEEPAVSYHNSPSCFQGVFIIKKQKGKLD